MDLLPDEMLDEVFQYLSAPERLGVCVRVCRRWQTIVERRAIALRKPGDEMRLHCSTRTVLLTTFPVDMSSIMNDIATRAHYLRELTAHAPAPFHDAHVASLSLLPHLTHLDIFLEPRVLDTRLKDVIKQLRTLVVNENIAPGLIKELTKASQLVALHMFGRSLNYPRPEMMQMLKARRSHLRELTLRCKDLSDNAYDVIGDCFNLRSLQLYSCWLLTATGAIAVCRPRLVRRLHVTGARLVHKQALAAMLELLPDQLDELVLSSGWFDDEHIDILERRVPRLRILELWHCKLTAEGAISVAFALPKLEKLDLDLTLTKRQLRKMARHPCLQTVRCIPADAWPDPIQHMVDYPLRKVNGLRLIGTWVQYECKYFGDGNEGFRSRLFYYWVQNMPLEPLPGLGQAGKNSYVDLFY